MKKLFIFVVHVLGLAYLCTINLFAEMTKPQQEVNRLNWVEIYKGPISTQIMFDFSQPVYFKKKILKENCQLKLTFPGMQLQQFSVNQVIAKLSKLKKYGLINNVYVLEKNKNISKNALTETPLVDKQLASTKKVVLIIEFAKTCFDKTHEKKPNKLLLKWCKMEDPNRLVIDIFSEDALENLKSKNATILYVKNDYYSSDTQPSADTKSKKKTMHIVIDAGHGGQDDGAKSFGFKEKNLSLSIAQKTKKLLQKQGHNVLLTRNEDKDLTLVERSKLAEQLKANLFVSIHVNSDGGKGSAASGVETFYLNLKEFVSPTRHGGFLFVNLKKDLSVLKSIDNFLKSNTQISQQLAELIQNNLIGHLRSQNFPIVDRGIKADRFRVLLRSPIPAALVEVGFITNPKEALQLSDEEYQQNIAIGIYNGITKFVSQQI
jgi:N-acetylmuramoyl-L-alanine amidase